MSLSVLHVAQPTEAGVAVWVRDLAVFQASRSLRVAVAAPSGGRLEEWLAAAGIDHLRWEATRMPGPSLIAETRRLGRLIDNFAPDVIHLHSSKAGLAGRLTRRRRGRGVVFQPHAWSFLATRGGVGRAALTWERFAADRAGAIVCVSRSERETALEQGIDGRLVVIQNGVDLTRWPPAGDLERQAARDSLRIGPGPVVVCAGRLSRQKGQDVLLVAWETVADAIPEARLFLVGDGPDRDALLARTGDGVELVGARDDVQRWYAAADVVVISSRWEGMSLSMLEAMASARPVVSTDVAGAREAIGDAGVVVDVEDPHALAGALIGRLQDLDRAREEGRRARERVEGSFDIESARDSIALLYEELIAQPKR